MKNIYAKYTFVGGIIGIFAWITTTVIAIPFLTNIFYYITFSFVSDNFIQEIGENIFIFIFPLLNNIFVFAVYGLLVAIFIKGKWYTKTIIGLVFGLYTLWIVAIFFFV